jgi:hypothetical protein
MKRSTWEGAISVIRWGTSTKVADRIPDTALMQLRLAHDLRNELVAIEKRYEAVKAAIWESCPELAEVERDLTAAQDVLEVVRARAKEERKADRTTAARRETRDALKEARAAVKEAKENRRQARDRLYPALAESFHLARGAYRAAIKAQYATYVQKRGLYWATYNAVVAHHQTAVQKIEAERRAGRAAELRFKRWNGEGTLAVQIQRASDDPVRSPQALDSRIPGSLWRNIADIPLLPENFMELPLGERRRASRQIVKIRLGAGEDRQPIWWEIPVVMHRPLPPDADVTGIEVTRRRVADHYRLSVAVTCRIPAKPMRTEGPVAGLDVGWRSLSDGSLRVGVVQVNGTMPDPPLHPYLRPLDGGVEIIVPVDSRNLYEELRKRRAVRDTSFNEARDYLAEWLETRTDVATAWETTPALMRQWRSPARLAALVWRWKDARFSGDDDAYEALEKWRKQDRHLWEWGRNEHDQLVARRNDAWHVLAAWLASFAATIRLGEWDISSVRRRPDVGVEDDEQQRASRHNAVIAGPGALREAVIGAAKREGVRIERPEQARLGITHFACGDEASDRNLAAERVVLWCETCQVGFDQDVNAARWLASGRMP